MQLDLLLGLAHLPESLTDWLSLLGAFCQLSRQNASKMDPVCFSLLGTEP